MVEDAITTSNKKNSNIPPEQNNSLFLTTQKPTQADFIMEMANKNAKFFHTSDYQSYAFIENCGHEEIWPLNSDVFERWIYSLFYRNTKKSPSRIAFQNAIKSLESKALFDGPEEKVSLRFGEKDGAIYVDLANKSSDQVKITKDGWEIISLSKSPVKFRRMKGMLQLPEPKQGKSLEILKSMLNIDSEEDLIMIASWLIGAMRPSGPFPILILQGVQGSSKSTTAQMLKCLIDPSMVPIRTLPTSDWDLAISADASWLLNYDNLSKLTPKMSDAFCRVATGGGFGIRSRYTNRSEELFYSVRPMILNGIPDLAERHDLADRSLFINLPAMPAEKRKPESELWREFYDEQPYLLGALFNAVSVALKNYDNVKVSSLPRMADFAKWVIAAEPALSWGEGSFMKAYDENRKRAIEAAIESDHVASAVIRLVNETKKWSGTPTELKTVLDMYAPEQNGWKVDWPKASNVLSNRLMRAQSFLETKGIKVERGKSGNRNITISMSEQSTSQTGQEKKKAKYAARLKDNHDDMASSGKRLRYEIAAEAEIASKQLGLEDECADNTTATKIEYEEVEI
uniref:ATP-binding protein n=1 Tax=uncultured Desulfobacterium sp. TaxID=201089 RepID=E1Y993_9BACT|nr:hypothetical protein N47_A11660 [uncultured Desulfobacterium sp.]